VRARRFRVWAIRTVDEGLEILTGRRAGKRRRDGAWEPGSIHAAVDRRLAELADTLRRYEIGPGR
jgi:hypothetical protein